MLSQEEDKGRSVPTGTASTSQQKKTTTTAFVWLPPGTEYTKEPSIGIYEETRLEVMQCPSHKSGSCADKSWSCVDKSGTCEEHSMLCPARQARRKSTLKKPQPNL